MRLASKYVLFVALTLGMVAGSKTESQPVSTLRFDRVVPYKAGEAIELESRVGTVRIVSVTFRPGKPGKQHTSLRVLFDAENVGPEEWHVNFMVDLTDDSGATIKSRNNTWEYGVKVKEAHVDFMQLPNDVLSRVKQARIRITAELD